MTIRFSLTLTAEAANVFAMGSMVQQLLDANPGFTYEHMHSHLAGGLCSALGETIAQPVPQLAPEPAADPVPAAEDKPKRTRRTKEQMAADAAAEAAAEAAAKNETPAAGEFPPIEERTTLREDGQRYVNNEVVIYLDNPAYRTAIQLRPGQLYVVPKGAVEVDAVTWHERKKVYDEEYAATVAARKAEAEAGNAAAASDAQAQPSTTAQQQTESTAPSADEPKEIAIETVREASNAAVTAGKRAEVLALIKKHGVESVSKTPPEKRAALLAELQALVQEEQADADAALA